MEGDSFSAMFLLNQNEMLTISWKELKSWSIEIKKIPMPEGDL